MKYMLDTNICIYTIKHKPPEVIKNFFKHKPDDMCISSITYGELMHGVEKSQAVERNRMAITLFLSAISILPFDHYAAEEYGKTWQSIKQELFYIQADQSSCIDKQDQIERYSD